MSQLTDLQADLALFVAARDKILLGEAVTIGNMSLRRPQLPFVEKRIQELRFDISRLQSTGGVSHSVPVFTNRRTG
jgi:hypothetical protein